MTDETMDPITRAYQRSVLAVDGHGYVAYEVAFLDGEWHVTTDEDRDSHSVYDTRQEARIAATEINRRLVASLDASERHNYLGR